MSAHGLSYELVSPVPKSKFNWLTKDREHGKRSVVITPQERMTEWVVKP